MVVTHRPFLSGLQPLESLWERPAHLLCLNTWQGCISQPPLQLSWDHVTSPSQWRVGSSDIGFLQCKSLSRCEFPEFSFP